MHHPLKVHPQFWEALASNQKPFEIRRNDRRFKVGDTLVLTHFDPSTGVTGDTIERTVSYILHYEDFPVGLQRGYVALGLRDPHAVLSTDAALAIGEHAFGAGFKAAESAWRQAHDPFALNNAWSNYDPPEEIKELI